MGFVLGLVVVGAFVTLGLSVTIGGNDAANALGPAVGSHAMTLRRAVVMGCVFEVLGVLLMGSFVSSTLRSEVVDPDDFGDPVSFANGMFAALLSSAACLLLFTLAALPVSTTQTVVGGIVGFGLVADNGVSTTVLGTIALTWLLSPLLSLALGYASYRAVQAAVFDAPDPAAASRARVPLFFALTAAVLGGFLGLVTADSFGLPRWVPAAVLAPAAVAGYLVARLAVLPRMPGPEAATGASAAEEPFRGLIVVTGAAVAYAQGGNDVANAIGPFATIVELHRDGFIDKDSDHVRLWILAIGAAGIAAGLVVLGSRVIATVGTKITHLTFSRGFAAQLSTSTVVMVCTLLAIPVSTTTTLIGAVAGVGYAAHRHEHLELADQADLAAQRHGDADGDDDDVDNDDDAGAAAGAAAAAEAPARSGASAAAQPKEGERKKVDARLVARIVASWVASVVLSGVLSAAIYGAIEAARG